MFIILKLRWELYPKDLERVVAPCESEGIINYYYQPHFTEEIKGSKYEGYLPSKYFAHKLIYL